MSVRHVPIIYGRAPRTYKTSKTIIVRRDAQTKNPRHKAGERIRVHLPFLSTSVRLTTRMISKKYLKMLSQPLAIVQPCQSLTEVKDTSEDPTEP